MKRIERIYRAKMSKLGEKGRVERSLSIFQETYSAIAKQITRENPSLSELEVRRRVALRLYSTEGPIVKLLHSIPPCG